MFSNRQLRRLIIPLMIDQFLLSAMGVADTLMVSNVSQDALSGVALVDSINCLVIYLFSAMATGGSIVCSQYLGRREGENACRAAQQMLLSVAVLSAAIAAVCVGLREPILRLIFGKVEAPVMEAALTYMAITAVSFPFIGLYNAGAAIYRAAGNSRLPLLIATCADVLNVIGNFILIFGLGWGVAGAAASTLVSRVLSSATVLLLLRRRGQLITVRRAFFVRPDLKVIGQVMRIGLPSGLENGMFQFGKLAVQSTVATLSTAAIAAQAVAAQLEAMSSMPSMGIGLGMMTVVGHCMGAHRPQEAKRYVYKLTLWSEGALVCAVTALWLATGPVTRLAKMTEESAHLTLMVMTFISILKLFLWVPGFTPPNGMRAAGDVNYPMVVAIVSMWVFRVGLSYVLCRVVGVGLIGIWIAWAADWLCRAIFYTGRLISGRWLTKQVLKE